MEIRDGRASFGIWCGAAGGIVLALLLKAAEAITSERVYTLLLNVDFIPWLPHPLPEWAELILHLAVALPLGVIYIYLLSLWSSPLWLGLGTGLAVGCCTWIPLTQLSERVPATDNWAALCLWLAGHIGYGLALAVVGSKWKEKKEKKDYELSVIHR